MFVCVGVGVCLVLGECPTSLCDQTISLIVSVKEKLQLKVSFYLFHDSLLCFVLKLLLLLLLLNPDVLP